MNAVTNPVRALIIKENENPPLYPQRKSKLPDIFESRITDPFIRISYADTLAFRKIKKYLTRGVGIWSATSLFHRNRLNKYSE